MKKKDLENEELDEIIDDEADDVVIDDEEDVIDDEEIDDEIEDEAPKTKKAKTNKKPLKKGAKIAIITSSSVVGVAAIVLVLLFAVLPALGINILAKGQSGKIVEHIDFEEKVEDYTTNPTAVTSSSDILAALTYDEDYMAGLYSSSKDKNLVAAQMLFAAYKNIATAHQYSYFSNKIGTTNLGSKSGTLIVQRMRRQNQDIKDDTTLKLPYNHNFGPIETKAVTGEGAVAIRYIKEGGIYRIKSNKITYNTKTGFLECSDWSRGKNWGDSETPDMSANITEARINYLSLVEGMVYEGDDDECDIDSPKAIFKKSTAKIEDKGDYYEIYVEVDSNVADNDEATAYYFEKDNGATNVHIAKCNITFEIWKCGLPKAYVVDETWSGKIQIYEGEANAKTEAKYSYADKDCNDDSTTEAIWKSLKK